MADRMPDGPWKGVLIMVGAVLVIAFLWGAAVKLAEIIVYGG